MATDNNVYELVHEWRLFNQVCNNVYFYQVGTGIVLVAQDLAEMWQAQILPSIRSIQSGHAVTTAIRTRNLMNGADTGEVLLSLAGTGYTTPNDVLPTFVSAGFTLARDTAETRNGAKRIGGQAEIAQDDGVFTDGTTLTNMATVADKLATVIDSLLGVDSFFPVIVKRLLDDGEYRLPATLAEAVVNAVVDGLFSILVTSQNSRKIGVGT